MSLGFNMKGKSNSLKKIYNKCDLLNTNTCYTIKKENKINNYRKEQDDSKKSYMLDTTKYIDLKRNVSYEFIRDSSSNNEIYIEEDGEEKKIEDLSYIPVYNEIAAGNPILINDLLADNYLLPKSWIRGSSNIFMLKIKGDSMINKNINDGDYVLINKQNFASIGDIVAVDIEGEATLKTYKIKDNKISLMPENDKYEPIILDENEFDIIGIAVGLIKN
ncbi:transcriptional repressor LexA [Clostridium saccharobutylicum]|nr:transcriptional repressor LexA [Clostridium saccharobutylicum]NOV80060.1 SOS regulatory protein LexA [Clostridium saccharobutylicum]